MSTIPYDGQESSPIRSIELANITCISHSSIGYLNPRDVMLECPLQRLLHSISTFLHLRSAHLSTIERYERTDVRHERDFITTPPLRPD